MNEKETPATEIFLDQRHGLHKRKKVATLQPVWRTKDGKEIPINKLGDEQHLGNILNLLIKHDYLMTTMPYEKIRTAKKIIQSKTPPSKNSGRSSRI